MKFKTGGALVIRRGVNPVSEAIEAVDCLFKALPRHIRWKAQRELWNRQRASTKNDTSGPGKSMGSQPTRKWERANTAAAERWMFPTKKGAPPQRVRDWESGRYIAKPNASTRRQNFANGAKLHGHEPWRNQAPRLQPHDPLKIELGHGEIGRTIFGNETVTVPGSNPRRYVPPVMRPGEQRLRPLNAQEKSQLIYDHMSQMDMAKAAQCMAAEQVEDAIYGRVGQALGKAGATLRQAQGVGTGPTF
jgi:hypothetical protein